MLCTVSVRFVIVFIKYTYLIFAFVDYFNLLFYVGEGVGVLVYRYSETN